MDLNNILSILSSDNSMAKTLYFTKKDKNGYMSFSPNVSEEILNNLIEGAKEYIEKIQLANIILRVLTRALFLSKTKQIGVNEYAESTG